MGNRPQTDEKLTEKPTAYASFASLLDRWDSPDLERASEELAGMIDHPGWRWFHRLIKERQQLLFDQLVHGKLADQATYAARTAMVSGLDQALHAAAAIEYAHVERDKQDAENARQAEARESEAA